VALRAHLVCQSVQGAERTVPVKVDAIIAGIYMPRSVKHCMRHPDSRRHSDYVLLDAEQVRTIRPDEKNGGVRKGLRPDEARKTDDNDLKLVTKGKSPYPFGSMRRGAESDGRTQGYLVVLCWLVSCLQSVAETGAHMTRYANSIDTYISQSPH
jgi:hypothetical protein